MDRRHLLVFSAALVGLCILTRAAPTPKPPTPFCKIVWLLGIPCTQANLAILSAIKAKEQYKLGAVTAAYIEANHTSIDGSIESLNFTMKNTTMGLGCRVSGISIATTWFSFLDNGTNYCNLFDIIHDGGLDKAPGFIEYTNEWLCLGFHLATCKFYQRTDLLSKPVLGKSTQLLK